jgi:hypothetical protein
MANRSNNVGKPCARCGGPKEKGPGKKLCSACVNEPAYLKARKEAILHSAEKTRRKKGIKPPKLKVREDGMVWCLGCHDYIHPSRFTQHNTKSKGLTYAPRCKKCLSAYQHEQRLRYAYGIDGEIYYKIFDHQNGVCYICQKRPHKKRLAVDHDHKTGEVRGLLCKTCNRDIIGSAKDEIAFLERAIEYLKNPPARDILKHHGKE